MTALKLDDLNKLRDLVAVIFRDVENEDGAWELVDSDVFQTALNATLDAWEWNEETVTIVNEMREARKKFESEATAYHTIILDVLIDAVKERINEANKPTSIGATEDGEIDLSGDNS